MHSIIDQPAQVRSPPTHPRPRKQVGGDVRVGSYSFVVVAKRRLIKKLEGLLQIYNSLLIV